MLSRGDGSEDSEPEGVYELCCWWWLWWSCWRSRAELLLIVDEADCCRVKPGLRGGADRGPEPVRLDESGEDTTATEATGGVAAVEQDVTSDAVTE